VENSHTIDLTCGFEAYVKQCREQSQQVSGIASGLPHQTIVRKQRLERQFGPVRFEMYDSNPRSLHQLLAWKSAQYNRARRPSDAFAWPWTVSLLERIQATRTETFAGVLSTLWSGDKMLAAHMGMRSASVLHWWFPAYDVTYSKFSPGLILLLELCRRAEDYGIQTIELGAGDEPYKLLVANRQIGVAAGFIGTPSLAVLYRHFLHISLDMITPLAIGPIAPSLGRLIRRLEKESRFDDFNANLSVLAKKAEATASRGTTGA
jgi:CelD/BcsL family acetyltransferase involved in cellulose biosynthesis